MWMGTFKLFADALINLEQLHGLDGTNVADEMNNERLIILSVGRLLHLQTNKTMDSQLLEHMRLSRC